MAGKKKDKKPKNPEKTKRTRFLALIALILLATAVLGIKLIKDASLFGVVVIVCGCMIALILFVTNMNRFRIYETVKDKTRMNEEKESEKLTEDMEKCKDRIAALDARAAESGGGGGEKEGK